MRDIIEWEGNVRIVRLEDRYRIEQSDPPGIQYTWTLEEAMEYAKRMSMNKSPRLVIGAESD